MRDFELDGLIVALLGPLVDSWFWALVALAAGVWYISYRIWYWRMKRRVHERFRNWS